MRNVPFVLLALVPFLAAGCYGWMEPLPDSAANLRLAVVTIALKENAGAEPRVTREEAEATVEAGSRFWEKACGISLVPVAHLERDSREDGVEYRAVGETAIMELQYEYAHENYVTVVFNEELRRDGDEQSWSGGIAPYPWSPRMAILMAGPLKAIFAHEMGHFLGLKHVADDDWEETRENDPWNQMFPGDFPDSFERRLEPVQCQAAREYLLGYSNLRPLCRPDSDDPEMSKENCPAFTL